MDESVASTTRYAILVGVDCYPEQPLKGCVCDVQEMATYLAKWPVTIHIQRFTASQAENPQSPGPAEDSKSWPTYDNVKSSMKRVTSLAKPGDFVYIHYSGHGTRIKPSAANKYFGDVAWNLLAGKKGDRIRYFRGVELVPLVNDMVKKGLTVTVVMDCCFSGGVSRDEGPDDVRALDYDAQVDMDYPPDPPPESLDLETAGDASRDGSMLPNWFLNPNHYTILAACGPHEVAKEIKFPDGRIHGALSYLLLHTLSNIDTAVQSQLGIYSNLQIIFRKMHPQQNPVLYGNMNLRFFDSILPLQRNIPIPIVLEKASGLLRLQGGQAHGVCIGDLFAISRFYSTGSDGLTADLELVDQNQGQNVVQTGWVAKALTRTALRQYPIALAANIPDTDKWLDAAKERESLAISRLDSLDCPFSFQVVLNAENNVYGIRDGSDQKLANLPVVSRDHEDAIPDILDVLEHLAWFKHVKAIANPGPTDDFLRSFDISILNRSGKAFDKERVIELKHRDVIVLEIQNKGQRPLYVHVYDLESSWEVENLCRGSYETVPARNPALNLSGRSKKRVKMTVPADMQAKGHMECDDVIKVFVTMQPTTFANLELPNINKLAKMDANAATIPSAGPGEIGIAPDDWIALNFHFHTTA
ncbi:Caspase domain-containing protein [Cladophialophora immunda]|nr:Caspase domain-containing protein [Cladophialophora immunda]